MVVVDEGEMKLWVDDMMDYGGDGEPTVVGGGGIVGGGRIVKSKEEEKMC
ncbi:hypothetical protein [Arabidopsis thaliana]|uniref:Uncharacterized protein T20E23_140 n=1 Tax=Arabidopsis thaliana TaxID=3702 RepID=Q9SCS1_ARATH|nr:hypothetical protein [Arabidopsis thaliana]